MLFCNRKIIFDHFCYRYFSACMFQNTSFVFINTKSCSKIWLCLRNRVLLQLLRILLPQSLNALKAKPQQSLLRSKGIQLIPAIILLISSLLPRQYFRKAKIAVICISPLQRPHYFTSSYTYLFSKKVILLSFLG